jgi:DMSO/TMAO reductase YedYZ molybdopterin-dependent catalytic subunit
MSDASDTGGSERDPGRQEEIDEIVDRKGGVRAVRDEDGRYTVVGAASRDTFANWLTPIGEHFVCHRNLIPEIDADSWTVSVSGPDGDLSLSMDDVRESFPTVAVAHTMECAGNDRGQHVPETSSVQWGCDAAGTAFWVGTPLSSVLARVGVDVEEAGSRWLTAIGGDSPEDDAFARSVPLEKALDDCLLAYGMNGEPLPEEHGYPVRVVVPGWYGVNSVKWVEELRVTDGMVTEGSLDRPGAHAYWQQEAYRIHPEGATPEAGGSVDDPDTWTQLESGDVEHPYTFDQNVMSLIGSPSGEASVSPRGGTVEVLGVAWAGDDSVTSVEVSTDGGETWADATMFGPDYDCAWRLFRYAWDADPGEHELYSRATDERGRTQPPTISDPEDWETALDEGEYPWNEGGYAANAYRPNGIDVTVEE